MPPLRERREDIAPLIDYLIRRHNIEMKKSYKGADNAAIRILMSLPWRGNIRELDNVLERAMILGNARGEVGRQQSRRLRRAARSHGRAESL